MGFNIYATLERFLEIYSDVEYLQLMKVRYKNDNFNNFSNYRFC